MPTYSATARKTRSRLAIACQWNRGGSRLRPRNRRCLHRSHPRFRKTVSLRAPRVPHPPSAIVRLVDSRIQ